MRPRVFPAEDPLWVSCLITTPPSFNEAAGIPAEDGITTSTINVGTGLQ